MDTPLPSFVLGYHGCDAELARAVAVGKKPLKPSDNDYDWLGNGIYFWESSPSRAYDFACEMAKRPHPSKQKIKKPAVVGAVINLGYCLNLLDSRYIAMVRRAHSDLEAAIRTVGGAMPINSGGDNLVARRLDCAVVEFLHKNRQAAKDPPFDSVRAAFFERPVLYENSGFASGNHIQICVRTHRCILGYFHPLDDDGKPRKFS